MYIPKLWYKITYFNDLFIKIVRQLLVWCKSVLLTNFMLLLSYDFFFLYLSYVFPCHIETSDFYFDQIFCWIWIFFVPFMYF